MNKIILTHILFTLGFIIDTQAQKLPNVQKESLRAPAVVNIDGKMDEWGDKFEAYNHATDLYYSIANDDANLYLAFRSTDPDAMTKILANGVDFTINTATQNDKNGLVSITFPYYPDNSRPYINFTQIPKTDPGSATSLEKADSLMKMYNGRLNNKVKYIKVTGVAGLDSVISIYNENGIRVKGAFDINMAYTYELAFPLKYLGLKPANSASFKYHVILHKATPNSIGIVATRDAYGRIISAKGPADGVASKSHTMVQFSTTDFKGEYTLANSNK